MILNKWSKLCVLFSVTVFSQQPKANDSIKVEQLTEVVVTGQFEPQSIKKSVFNVRVISSEDIKNLAANSLSDVLTQNLNITVQPNGSDGRSTVSLFGLDARYFKIIIDNVPLVNEGGVGNNTDLSQINLNDIERIEIVEGSMGVTHGANAVTGLLNIITKKSSKNKWDIYASVQEETVRDEFEFFDKGRHVQSLKVSHNINPNWYVSVGANRNDFAGFFDGKKGKNYFENDGLRGYNWLPKEQCNATAVIAYNKNSFRAFYKFEILDEGIDFYNSTVQSGLTSNFTTYRYAADKRYQTNRYFHNLNTIGKLWQLNYNVSVSHQKQARSTEYFEYNLSSRDESKNETRKDQSMEVFYSTGTLSNFFRDKKVDLQLGYEITEINGFSDVSEENYAPIPVWKRLGNYDFFVSSEIKATQRFSIRTGLRVSLHSKFTEQYASSLALRYLFDNNYELRASYGNSFRTPTFEELYYRFVNDSHYFVGNEDLKPETGTSYELSVKKNIQLISGLRLASSFSANYMDVDDKIEMAFIRSNPVLLIDEYQSINISKYKVWNISTHNQLKSGNLKLSLGAALIGISQRLENQLFSSDEQFLYSFNLNCSASYFVPKWKTTFSAYYKYVGKTQQFEKGNAEYVITTLDDSNWLDSSVRKSFWKDKLEATMGARNLLDITNINRRRGGESGAHDTSSQRMMAYGRSYFIKLSYNLNF